MTWRCAGEGQQPRVFSDFISSKSDTSQTPWDFSVVFWRCATLENLELIVLVMICHLSTLQRKMPLFWPDQNMHIVFGSCYILQPLCGSIFHKDSPGSAQRKSDILGKMHSMVAILCGSKKSKEWSVFRSMKKFCFWLGMLQWHIEVTKTHYMCVLERFTCPSAKFSECKCHYTTSDSKYVHNVPVQF